MAKKRIMVAVDEAHQARIGEVAERLRACGVEISGEMPTLGAISGEVDDARIGQVARVEGVLRVSESKPVRALKPVEPNT